jgi:hypothetical protein
MRAGYIALVVLLLGCLPAAALAQPVETIVQDDALFLHGEDAQIREALARARDLGIDRVRLTAGWSVIAPNPDIPDVPAFDAADPAAYPAGAWANLDRAVRMVREAGLAPMIDIAFWAPRWATREPAEMPDRLAEEIDPARFGEFAAAVARRYAGGYAPPLKLPRPTEAVASPDGTFLDDLFGRKPPVPPPASIPLPAEPALPAVDVFTVWNEPNHSGFLRPQWVMRDGRWAVRSADIYRAMVRAAYPAIKAKAPGARVLIGGTASMGSSTPGVGGVPPLAFLRALACVDASLVPVTDGECAGFTRLPGDGWAHHPYSLRTTPDVDPKDRDKLPVAATARLAATLRALADAGRVDPSVADLYMTEYGYETNPPDTGAPFSLDQQGPLLAWAEYIATREPAVRSWPQFQLYDRPDEATRPGARPFGDWHSGLFFHDGTAKPAAALYAVPAFAGCVPGSGGKWVVVWGRRRGRAATGAVEARTGAGAWAPVATFDAPAIAKAGRAKARASVAAPSGEALTRYVARRRGTAYRIRWTAQGDERISAAVKPAAAGCRRVAKAAARRPKPKRRR